ncbi:MAG: hypothetical protein KDB22_26045 [Planctomycetales bacterium]|nr:hypothetical protein [Planctomycetales bacterium]
MGANTELVYAKLPHSNTKNLSIHQRRLGSEFDTMKLLAKKWRSDSPYGVIEPLAFYPDLPAIVTCAAPGYPLRYEYRSAARLLGFPRHRRKLLECVSHCGVWLREFQDATVIGRGPFDVDELLSYCNPRIEMLLESEATEFSKHLAESLTSSVRQLGESLSSEGVLITGRHNDFASHNVVSKDGSIRVIDFSMFDSGAAAFDLCNFWFELEMLKCDWTYSNSFLSRLQQRFLAAYGTPKPKEPDFSLARVRYTLNRLLTALNACQTSRADARYRQRVVGVSYDWLQNFTEGNLLT